MIPATQPSVHPCADIVPGDEVVWSLMVVGDVVGSGVGAIIAIRNKCCKLRCANASRHVLLSLKSVYRRSN